MDRFADWPKRKGPLSFWAGYGLAAGATALAALARWLVPWALAPAPYLGFYPAVVVSAALGGVGPGLISTFGSLFLVNFVFGRLNYSDTGAIMRQVIWVVASIGVSILAGKLRDARERAEQEAATAREGDVRLRESLLEQSRQREFLECVIANSGSCIAVVKGHELRYTMANQTFQMFAADGPMVGRTYRDVFPEAAEAGAEIAVRHVLETGEPWKVESYLAPVPGKADATWQGQVVRLPVEAGEETSALVVVWDITERKRAEEAVRQSGKIFNEIIERSPFGTYVVDSQFHIAMMNTASQSGAFLNVQPVIGRNFAEVMRILWPEEVAAEIIGFFRHTLDTGEPYYAQDFINPRRDAEIVEAYEWELHRMTLPDGQYGVICYYYDSTKLREAEKSLRKSEERFRLIAENLSEGLMLFDPQGDLLYQNPASLRIHGYSVQEEGGIAVEDLPVTWKGWDDQHRPLPFDQWPVSRVLRGEYFQSQVLHALRTDTGLEFDASYNGCPIYDEGRLVLAFITIREITEHRKSEMAWRESEERFRVAQELSPDGFSILRSVRDPEGCVVDFTWIYANTASERIVGMKLPALAGRSLLELFPGHRESPFLEAYRQVAETGQTRVLESLYQGDGILSQRWFRVAVVSMGQDIAVLSQDITERKGTEETLRLTQESIDCAAEMVAWFTPDGRVHYVNDATCRALGYSRDELLQMTALDFSPGFTWEQYREHWQEVRERKSFSLETTHRRKDGSEYPAEVLVNYILFGEREYLFAYGRDITERKQAEEQMDKLARQRQLALDAAHMGWWHYDPITKVASWDDGYKEIFGVTGHQSPNEEILARIHPDDLPGVWAKVEAALDLADPQPYVAEYRINLPDGDMRWIEAHGVASFEGEGDDRHATSFVGTVADISGRKRAEERIKASLAEKEVMLKEIHHRVKNNLQVISSLVNLQADGTRDETVRGMLRDVTYRVRSMALVHEKLYQSADLAHVDFAEYARSLLGYLWRAHGAKADAIRLTFDLEPLLLPVDIAVPCGLILNELAGNALKHAFPDQRTGEVNISLHVDAERLVSMSVRDDGVGLPEGLDWRKARSLGLRLMQMLAGQLNAITQLNRLDGTEFLITFKLPETALDGEALHG